MQLISSWAKHPIVLTYVTFTKYMFMERLRSVIALAIVIFFD